MQTFGNDMRPDSQNVSEIRSLDYLIGEYPNEDLIPQFRRLQQTYPCYRAIRGDGNCFYRAIAFLYLREADLSRFSNVFKDIQNFCVGHTLQFQTISFREKLKVIYNYKLFPIRETFGQTREYELTLLFNSSVVFDMIMIMYFRSINYIFIRQNEQHFKNFVTQRDTIERIRKYFADSEGIEYESMAKALNVQIEMKITDEIHLQSAFYNKDRLLKLFEIFFRPGHFDLLYHKNSPYLSRFLERQQKNSVPKMTPRFTDAQNYLQSRSIQWNRKPQIPMQSYPTFYPQKNAKAKIPQPIKLPFTPQKQPIQKNVKDSPFMSPFASLSNLRSNSKKQNLQQPISQSKKSQVKDKDTEKLIQLKTSTQAQTNSFKTEKYKVTQNEIIDQRQPGQKIKQFLMLILFFTGLGYVCYRL